MAKTKGAEQFREFVKARRQRLGLSQIELTEKSGLSYGFIGMLESGNRQGKPRNESLTKLARGLKLPSETGGEVKNFLELLIAGVVPPGAATRVAEGALASRVMSELAKTPADEFENYPSTPSKLDRLDQVLHTLEVDLEPEDFNAIAHLLRHFYKASHGSHAS